MKKLFLLASALVLPALQAEPVLMLTPAQVARGQEGLGKAVETSVILGSASLPSGGTYHTDINDTDLSTLKLPFRLPLRGEPYSIGAGEMGLTPFIEGSVAYQQINSLYTSPALQGNRTDLTSIVASLGGGAKWSLNDAFGIYFSLVAGYSYTENDFRAQNQTGRDLRRLVSEDILDWSSSAITWIPSVEAEYLFDLKPFEMTFSSRYNYFSTESFGSSDDLIDFSSTSHVWINRLETLLPLDWELLGSPMATRFDFERSELFGGIDDSIGTNHLWAAGLRLFGDTTGRIPLIDQLGIATTYYWGDDFSGWSYGIHAQVNF